MPRKGENIHKRKDGRWEARYIKGYDSAGKVIYGYIFGKSYLAVKRKRRESATLLPTLSVLPTLPTLTTSANLQNLPTVGALGTSGTCGGLFPITQIVQIGGNISNCYKANHDISNVLVISGSGAAGCNNDCTSGCNAVVTDDAGTVHSACSARSTSSPSSPLLSDLALQWLESLISIRKKSTVVKYAGQLKNYILPAFGDKRIDCVTTTDLMDFSRWLLRSGRKDGKNNGHLSPRTVINILAEMKSIKKFAVLRGFEVKYVTEYVEVPRQTALLSTLGADYQQQKGMEQSQSQRRKKVLTIDEQKKLMSYLKETINDSMKTDQKGWLSSFGIMLSLSTGIRLGELCALKWNDFSLEDGEFRIQRTMQRLPVSQMPAVPTTSGLLISGKADATVDKTVAGTAMTNGKNSDKHNRKTAVEIGAPKSQCSIRTIPIPEAIMSYVREAYEVVHSFNGIDGSECDDAFLLTGTREVY